jgi:hypothetical protein
MCYTTEEIVYERKNVLQQEIRVRELDVVARTESVIICRDSLRERMNKNVSATTQRGASNSTGCPGTTCTFFSTLLESIQRR